MRVLVVVSVSFQDRVTLLEGQATNEKVLSLQLQESEQENSSLAASVQRMQLAIKEKEAEKIRLASEIRKSEEQSERAIREASVKEKEAVEAGTRAPK